MSSRLVDRHWALSCRQKPWKKRYRVIAVNSARDNGNLLNMMDMNAGIATASAVAVPSVDLESVAPVANGSQPDPIRQDALEYAELRRIIRKQGLLDRQRVYYLFKVPFTVAMVAASVAFLVMVDTWWLQLLNAVFLGCVFAQLGLIGHDALHQQICASVRRNDMVSLLVGFLMALVPSWWTDKHNKRHHRSPNRLGEDADIDVSLLAFTEERALESKGFARFSVKYQAFMFYPILPMSSISFLFAGIHYALTGGKVKYPVVEPMLVLAHLAAYFSLLFFFLDPLHAVLFIAVHKAIEGVYMGSVFAPNHKGMPVLEKDIRNGFMRDQATTSRNVFPHPLTDFIYGGLNYQIEHHLFPNMPRKNFKKARQVVKEFCLARSIPYHETSVLGSQREILGYLHRVSAPLRRKAV